MFCPSRSSQPVAEDVESDTYSEESESEPESESYSEDSDSDSYDRRRHHRRRRGHRRGRGRRSRSRTPSPPAREAGPDQAGDQARPAAGGDDKKADIKHGFNNIYISKNHMRLSVDDIVPQTYAAMTPRGLHVIPSHLRSHVATFDPVTLELKEVSGRS